VTVGLTHQDQKHPFRKWLQPGETWESPWAFICPYRECREPARVLSGPVADYVRRHLGLRLAELKTKPQFLYCTWYPYGDRISEPLILDLAKGAAACGVKDFLIDAGWFRNEFSPPRDPWWAACGDYLTDPKKFPRGLPPVFRQIQALGMRPCLWSSLATVGASSRAMRDHPEWMVRDRHGDFINLHIVREKMFTACMTTPWYDHAKSAMLNLIKENDLKYLKVDLAFLAGAYRFDEENTGCYAKGHPHKDREESLWMIYEQTWKLFDELHAAAPDLYIDCTYETMGDYQLIDLEMCKHADGNWLLNCSDQPPWGPLRLRNLAWWTSPGIPASSLVLGCMQMEWPEPDLMMASMAGTFPVMLGNPRKLPPELQARYRQWSHWLEQVQATHDYLLYRQDLAGFGEPQEGAWDGFQRINTETQSGGIVGVFRQGAKENQRRVFVERLDSGRIYEIRRGPDDKPIGNLSGKELEETGFAVELEKVYDGAVFEIRQVK
jgi:alpha-galactosidase